MADKAAEGMTTPEPTGNTVINPETGEDLTPKPQEPGQFNTLGWSEASRLENTAEQDAADRKAAEDAAKKK